MVSNACDDGIECTSDYCTPTSGGGFSCENISWTEPGGGCTDTDGNACTFARCEGGECTQNNPVVGSCSISLDPTSIPAKSIWQTILPWAAAELAVAWNPPECEGTLEIVELVGDGGYVPPTSEGSIVQLDETTWLYRAFLESQTEICPQGVNVKIAALFGDVEVQRVSVRVLPIHTWQTTPHQHGPGVPGHAPDLADWERAFDYLSWKYGGVLATSGGDFDQVVNSTNGCVPCLLNPCVFACTTWVPLTGYRATFGTNAFSGSENQGASIIGHELRHTAVGLAAGECPAYQWEADHAQATGIADCDPGYLFTVNVYLSANCSP